MSPSSTTRTPSPSFTSAPLKRSKSPSPSALTNYSYDGPRNVRNYSAGTEPHYGQGEVLKLSYGRRIIDSFKPYEGYQKEQTGGGDRPSGVGAGNEGVGLGLALKDARKWDGQAAAYNTAHAPLARRLKGRHLQMIAIGGSIGTGLFVASGKALAAGGPASLLIAFSLIGIMLYCTVHALGEMAVLFPVAGSFSAYSTRFLDPAWGFAMGWNYAMQWLVVLPLEIIAASITINYWNDTLSRSIFIAIFLAIIVGLNLIGVKGYGEAEFVFSIIKVTAVIGFILLGIVINCGGGAEGGYIGGHFWHDPGAFNHGFKGLCSVFVTAAFSFAGTELVGLAAAETENPRKSLPKAIKQVFWRITLFYVISLTIVGLLVGYNNPRLLSGKHSVDITASPFVIAIEDAGIALLPSVMNVVILISVLSVGNSSIFGSSRTLAALASQGQAPAVFAYVDRKGRPLASIVAASAFGLLAFVGASHASEPALDWLVALSGLSSILTWGSINLAHIRFRHAWAAQGHTLDELAFRSQPGIYGSYLGLLFNVGILAAQFWTGAWPDGYVEMGVMGQVKSFFLSYLAAPVVLAFYAYWKIVKRSKVVRSAQADIASGQRELDLDLKSILSREREGKKDWAYWKRGYDLVC